MLQHKTKGSHRKWKQWTYTPNRRTLSDFVDSKPPSTIKKEKNYFKIKLYQNFFKNLIYINIYRSFNLMKRLTTRKLTIKL